MPNAFEKSGRRLTPSDFTEAEKVLGFPLPNEVKMEYLGHNGGIPKLAQGREHEDDDVWIKAFLPMRERVSYGKSMAETYTTGLREKYLPQGLVPFAVDHGGNYLCFNHRGEVFFCGIDAWDPDKTEQQNQVEVVTPLCLSFRAFVQGLRRGESLD